MVNGVGGSPGVGESPGNYVTKEILTSSEGGLTIEASTVNFIFYIF
jgi:hypothetical protein